MALRYSTPQLMVYPREPHSTIRKSSQAAAGEYGSFDPADLSPRNRRARGRHPPFRPLAARTAREPHAGTRFNTAKQQLPRGVGPVQP